MSLPTRISGETNSVIKSLGPQIEEGAERVVHAVLLSRSCRVRIPTLPKDREQDHPCILDLWERCMDSQLLGSNFWDSSIPEEETTEQPPSW